MFTGPSEWWIWLSIYIGSRSPRVLVVVTCIASIPPGTRSIFPSSLTSSLLGLSPFPRSSPLFSTRSTRATSIVSTAGSSVRIIIDGIMVHFRVWGFILSSPSHLTLTTEGFSLSLFMSLTNFRTYFSYSVGQLLCLSCYRCKLIGSSCLSFPFRQRSNLRLQGFPSSDYSRGVILVGIIRSRTEPIRV